MISKSRIREAGGEWPRELWCLLDGPGRACRALSARPGRCRCRRIYSVRPTVTRGTPGSVFPILTER